MFMLDDVVRSLPLTVTNILQEYEDVFPLEIPPGLPPLRGIEHQIDLIPGAALPNRAAPGDLVWLHLRKEHFPD